MLVHIKDIVNDARKKKYAIGAFNVHTLETILGVARAAYKAKSPAIIQVSESAIKYMGLKPITHIVSTVAKNIALGVPIALHLDHGKSFESVTECINAGFSSVHIDVSHLPLDENIALTNQVIKLASKKGIWVQGEVGPIVGGHGNINGRLKEIPIANIDEVIKFVKYTKVNTLSVAIGTAHGAYENEYIDMPLLREIKRKTKKIFVLHGASGIKDSMIKKAIRGGADIINIGTDIKVAFCRALIDNCFKNKNETDPRNLLSPTIPAVEKIVLKKMKIFGSAGMSK